MLPLTRSRLNGARPVVVAGPSGPVDGSVVQVAKVAYATLVVASGSATDQPVDNATDGTGFVVSLTPTSASSRIHLSFTVHEGFLPVNPFTINAGLRLYRKVGAGGGVDTP